MTVTGTPNSTIRSYVASPSRNNISPLGSPPDSWCRASKSIAYAQCSDWDVPSSRGASSQTI